MSMGKLSKKIKDLEDNYPYLTRHESRSAGVVLTFAIITLIISIGLFSALLVASVSLAGTVSTSKLVTFIYFVFFVLFSP